MEINLNSYLNVVLFIETPFIFIFFKCEMFNKLCLEKKAIWPCD